MVELSDCMDGAYGGFTLFDRALYQMLTATDALGCAQASHSVSCGDAE